ncbi:MAG: leucine-rich repeat domain-containing protein [Clostridia bacterium]|nr:leucine-rich repeat domain-containing protein [Clostridia bacterium]
MKASFRFNIENTVLIKCETIYSERDPSASEQTIEPECTDLAVPEGITKIGREAFSFIHHVRQIILPEGITEIDMVAFENSSLESITFPSSLRKISGNAFLGCKNLKKVQISDIAAWCSIEFTDTLNWTFYRTINDAILYIHDKPVVDLLITADTDRVSKDAFSGYRKLRSVRMEEGVRAISNSAFSDCTALESVSLPDSVTSLGRSAFSRCESLREVRLPSMIEEIPDYFFYECRQLSSIAIPDTVRTVGEYAFAGCTDLREITIAETVRITNLNAFADCPIDPAMLPKSYQERYCSIYTVCEEDVSEIRITYNETVCYFRKVQYDLSTARKIRKDASIWRLHSIHWDDDAWPRHTKGTSEDEISKLMSNKGGKPLDHEAIYVKDGLFGGFLFNSRYDRDLDGFVSLSGQCTPVVYYCSSSVHGYDHSYTSYAEQWAFPVKVD